MTDQDAKDINNMMSATSDMAVSVPKKSKFVWIVLLCVVIGIALGIFVYQRSLRTIVPSPTPRSAVVTPVPSPIPSPVVPVVNLVQPEPKTISFPKAGEIRVYYEANGWLPLGIELTDSAGVHNLSVPAGNPNTQMKVFDTGYTLTGPTTISIESFLGTDNNLMSIGWAKPDANKCGFNGFGVVDITPDVTFATAQAQGEPIVSVQCWGDYSPNPNDTSALDFNDYFLIWSYTPVAGSTSPSPRVTMPDTSEGTPVTGIFEVTVGTVSLGLILLVLGLFGLLAL